MRKWVCYNFFYYVWKMSEKTYYQKNRDVILNMSLMEKLEEIISGLSKTAVHSKSIPKKKSSEADINKLQSKILEL